MMRFTVISLAAVACAHASQPSAPAPPTTIRPALPPRFALKVVVKWRAGHSPARLRLDGGGRPYLVTNDTLVPLARLPSGADAKPFRIGGVSAIADVTWLDDSVMLLVVGRQLGAIGEHGFSPVLDLPAPDMQTVFAGPDKCWLFAPRSTGDGRLYLYEKAGTLTEILRAPAAIHAVSGSPERAYAAIGSSIVRIASSGATELVLDGGEPIVALALAGDSGVFFSTSTGTFFLSNRNAITRLTQAGASAIETRGDDVFLVLDDLGVVHGAPVSAFAS